MGTPRKRTDSANSWTSYAGEKKFVCCRCGTAYSRQKGYFPVSHSPMYRGTGYLPWCNDCIEDLYEGYRNEFGSDEEAMKRMCMKMDMYWSPSIYKVVERTAGVNSRVRSYIVKSNISKYIDKTFDDSLKDGSASAEPPRQELQQGYVPEDDQEDIDVPEDVVLFWGPGFTPKMYMELEERRAFWMSRFPDGYQMDIGEEALIRQICNLEIDINHDRAAGKSIDKGVNTLNTLLGSLNLKPNQKKEDTESDLDGTPFGVWIRRYENTRPIPEPDPDLKDVDGLVRYIEVWFKGHLAKMLKIKNSFSKIYEEEIDKLRVERPEYDEEDDEGLFQNIFSSKGDSE